MSAPPKPTPYRFSVHEMPRDERPRERLQRYGANTLQTSELLAIIFGSGIVGENVVDLSARLLREFGGLSGLLNADVPTLCAQRGLGPVKAVQLKAALELGRRLNVLAPEARPQISSPADAAALVMLEMGYLSQEQLRVLCLDTKNLVVHQQVIYQGTVNTSVVRAAEVYRPAVTRNTPAIIVLHNHPSGDPAPSPEDVRTTEQLVQAGEVLDIELLDHIVVGQNRWVSLKERRLGFR
jgi:DNA repair protein RadC